MKSHEKMYAVIQPLIVSGKPEETIPVLENLIDLWPDFAIVHNDLGVIYYNLGEREKARTHYEASIRYQPENITFQKNLADFYYVVEGRVDDALKIYIKVLECKPEDIEILLVVGHICVSLHRFDDAKAFYRRVLEIEPWNLEVQENLKKLENINRSEINPESAEEMYRELHQKADQDQPHEVIQGLKKLIEVWPDFAAAHNDLGVLYYNIGEKKNALNHYKEAARYMPENTIFQKNLADFYYVEEGRVEDALRIYVDVLRAYPQDVEALLATGHICESLKKTGDAKVFYDRVLEIEPWNFEAREKIQILEPTGK